MITREQFVKLCTICIQETRRDIAVTNQKSGYLMYHDELRMHDYFSYARSIINSSKLISGYSLEDAHEITKATKMGNCGELADYLCVEILEKLNAYKINPAIRIVKSKIFDHEFLHIETILQDEIYPSLWEVDAWDPRIIDISMRPNNTIKNQEVLEAYGTNLFLTHTVTLETHNENKRKRDNGFFANCIKKPKKSPPVLNEEDYLQIFEECDVNPLYKDYSLDNAYRNKELDPDGEIHYLQKKSSWQ